MKYILYWDHKKASELYLAFKTLYVEHFRKFPQLPAWDREYDCPHFIDEQTDFVRLVNEPKATQVASNEGEMNTNGCGNLTVLTTKVNYNCVRVVTVIAIMDKNTTNKLSSTQLLGQPHIFNSGKLHQTSVVPLLLRAKYMHPRTKILNHSIKSQLFSLPSSANDTANRENRFASPPGLWECTRQDRPFFPALTMMVICL